SHEEAAAAVARELGSYKQLPQRWYQVRTAFRDEPRPKGGLLRAREFTLADAYSFDLDQAGLEESFAAFRDAYARIFERLGVPALPVAASAGTAGGADATGFVCLTEAGEDVIVRSPGCGYAADADAAVSRVPQGEDGPGLPAPEPFDTPGVRTIEDLARGHGAPADRQIKTLVYAVDDRLTLVLLRGDHALNERKLLDATGAASLRPAEPEEIRAALGALPGSLGAVGVADLPVIADEALRGRRAMFTGANVDDVHLRGVDVERDIAIGSWADLRQVAAGEPCPRCGEPLLLERAVEAGRVARLGDRYARALGAEVLDRDGKRVPLLMGGYGIGIERAMAAAVEVHHDERGIVWPPSIAPFHAVVVVAQTGDADVAEAGEEVYRALLDAGVDAVIDDRPDRAGVKFRDAELTGIPFRITVGRRGLAEGTVELTHRATGATEKIPRSDAAARVAALLT
ncbi:MAG: proline--tRNA ligase, partial [Actinomadura rubrobrunea]|nr:proline--tRNA ligase [Actinomadura rubrobrunea]